MNQTVTAFVMIGLKHLGNVRIIFFIILMIIFIFIIIGNLSTSVVILMNKHLHAPMYILIGFLSILELACATVSLPGILSIISMGSTYISTKHCFAQMYLLHCLGITENFLLNIMAFDRYVAICRPLQYHAIMTTKVCIMLVSCCWILGILCPLPVLILVSELPFCGSFEIHHILCDSSPVLGLACADTTIIHTTDLAVGLGVILITSVFILMVYIKIIATIMKMRHVKERKKAFSSCISHFAVVLIFYSSVAFMYIVLHGDFSAEYEEAVAINYYTLTPLFNPIIYSFRNKEIKKSLNELFKGVTSTRNFSFSPKIM
ncbi:olfactory receptor 6N2-like [Hyperolius riggenbachi]|uniref:olfactory receptor 6N2-like n=1 Tax=Hyperolius riggenbachi TaxID=752182 RepID=UPI0035A32CFE